MLQKTIKTKTDLIALLNGTHIKSILANDIQSEEQLKTFANMILSMLRNRKTIALFAIES